VADDGDPLLCGNVEFFGHKSSPCFPDAQNHQALLPELLAAFTGAARSDVEADEHIHAYVSLPAVFASLRRFMISAS
jgi:hypothetical protein